MKHEKIYSKLLLKVYLTQESFIQRDSFKSVPKQKGFIQRDTVEKVLTTENIYSFESVSKEETFIQHDSCESVPKQKIFTHRNSFESVPKHKTFIYYYYYYYYYVYKSPQQIDIHSQIIPNYSDRVTQYFADFNRIITSHMVKTTNFNLPLCFEHMVCVHFS
jgi:hypothetical protein